MVQAHDKHYAAQIKKIGWEELHASGSERVSL